MTTPAPVDERPWIASYGPQTSPKLAEPAYPHLAALFDQVCARYAAAPAFTAVLPNGMFGNLSFSRLHELAEQFAAYLREELGLQAGDRVAVQLPNSLAYPICAFAVFKAGCVLVNVNPLYTASEMAHQLRDSGAKVLVIVDLFADKLPEALPQTDVGHVVLARIPDLFPALPGFIAHNVMKYWNRIIPQCTVEATMFREALAKGAARRVSGASNEYAAAIGPDTIAALQYTGGTTGVSKGAMLTHGNLLANVAQLEQMVRPQIDYGKECTLAVLPLYHIFAFTVNLLFFFAVGSRNILVASPRPLSNLQRAFENYPITWVPGVNTLFNGLMNEEWFADYPPPRLRGAVAGGTALHEAVARRWEKLTGVPIIEGYGLTESAPVVSFNPIDGENRIGTIGIPVPDTDVKLLDMEGNPVAPGEAGELAVRGPQVMSGYWQRPDETARVLRDGWLLTGDIALMEAGGYFRIVDRKKDLILVSGFNVYPNEVEDCIAKLEQVLEVAVIGVPDQRSGEAVQAYIVLNPGHELSGEQVREHCRKHLAAYKVPRQIEMRAELPKSPVGKVLRRVLRDEILARASGAVPLEMPVAKPAVEEVGNG
ncbi:MAG: AMP-binding protein [Oscillochloris sp.]|nr:AMP-binding protein [Oscillochloris sp.]